MKAHVSERQLFFTEKKRLSLYSFSGIATIIASVVGTDKVRGMEISKLESKHEEGRSQRKKD